MSNKTAKLTRTFHAAYCTTLLSKSLLIKITFFS